MADEAPPVATDAVSSNQTPAANSSGSKLKELIDAANLQYSLKNYANAADLYSSATELQAELNGEMAPENADLLYLYGRCLFKVAVAKSGVLGGQVAGEKKKSTANGASKQKGDSAGDTLASNDAKLAEGIVVAALEQKDAPKSAGHEETTPANQPYFQITGMENWDSEEEDGEDGGEAEEEEDDFANAFEILDLARVLLQREIEAVVSERTNTSGKGKAAESDKSALSSLRERLADTQDLQAEIALENERFSDAATDFKASLALKQELHPKESEIIAEAHYKLSLALEFASMNKVREAQAEEGQQMMMVKKDDIDEELRREAAKEMELAIESCRLRIAKEEALLDTLDSDAAKEKAKSIAEVKEIVTDMEQKVDLALPVILHRVTNKRVLARRPPRLELTITVRPPVWWCPCGKSCRWHSL